MGLKMGKASQVDLDIAQDLILFLNLADEGKLPAPDGDSDDSVEFDVDNFDDLERFHELAMTFVRRPSALERVVWGMQCIIDSDLLDPNQTVLESHPILLQTKMQP